VQDIPPINVTVVNPISLNTGDQRDARSYSYGERSTSSSTGNRLHGRGRNEAVHSREQQKKVVTTTSSSQSNISSTSTTNADQNIEILPVQTVRKQVAKGFVPKRKQLIKKAIFLLPRNEFA
jgi:hypothetical protein